MKKISLKRRLIRLMKLRCKLGKHNYEYINWAIPLFGIIWIIPALLLIDHFKAMNLPDLVFLFPACITIFLPFFFKSDRIGFWDKFKRCQSKYNRGGLSGTVRCDMRVGHPGNHRYIGWGLGRVILNGQLAVR